MRKFSFLLLIFFIIFSGLLNISQAQTPSWKWAKWSNGTQTTARSACVDASGNLYSTGSYAALTKFDTANLTASDKAAFVVKYNTSGVLIWARNIKNAAFGAADAKSIAIDGSGNIYVSGAYTGTITCDSKTLTGSDHYVAKFDNSGAIQWMVNASGSNAVAANASGVYVAGGSIIQKFDGTGATLWTISGVKSNTGYTNFFSVALNSSGNLIAGGDIDDNWTFATKAVTGGFQNIVLMEVTSAGAVSWTKVLGANANTGDHLQHLCLDSWNNILLTGRIGGACNFDAVSLASKNGYLAKLSPSGTTIWASIYTNTATIYGDGGMFVGTDPAGAAYITGGYGTVDVTNGSGTKYITGIKVGANAFVLKFDSAGTFKSALTNFENTIINNSRGMAVVGNASGVYFAGVCAPNSQWGTLTVSGYGSVFAKIDGSTASGIDSRDAQKNIAIYPNPSQGNLIIDGKNSERHLQNYRIINMAGATLMEGEITNEMAELQLSELQGGVYFLILNTSQGQWSKKLIRL